MAAAAVAASAVYWWFCMAEQEDPEQDPALSPLSSWRPVANERGPPSSRSTGDHASASRTPNTRMGYGYNTTPNTLGSGPRTQTHRKDAPLTSPRASLLSPAAASATGTPEWLRDGAHLVGLPAEESGGVTPVAPLAPPGQWSAALDSSAHHAAFFLLFAVATANVVGAACVWRALFQPGPFPLRARRS